MISGNTSISLYIVSLFLKNKQTKETPDQTKKKKNPPKPNTTLQGPIKGFLNSWMHFFICLFSIQNTYHTHK